MYLQDLGPVECSKIKKNHKNGQKAETCNNVWLYSIVKSLGA